MVRTVHREEKVVARVHIGNLIQVAAPAPTVYTMVIGSSLSLSLSPSLS